VQAACVTLVQITVLR